MSSLWQGLTLLPISRPGVVGQGRGVDDQGGRPESVVQLEPGRDEVAAEHAEGGGGQVEGGDGDADAEIRGKSGGAVGQKQRKKVCQFAIFQGQA